MATVDRLDQGASWFDPIHGASRPDYPLQRINHRNGLSVYHACGHDHHLHINFFQVFFNARFGARSGPLSFAVTLFCGLLPWIAISEGIQRATVSITENVNLVKRVVFPIEALPLNPALTALLQQMIGKVVLVTAVVIVEGALHPTLVLTPLLVVPQLLVTLGLGWMMASLCVFIRDTPQFTQLSLTTWIYLTPIFYPEDFSSLRNINGWSLPIRWPR